MTKKNNEFLLLKRILTYIMPYKQKLGIILICLIISTIFGFYQPLIIRRITDEGMLQSNMQVILWSVLILMLLVCANQLLELVQARLFADLHNKMKYSIWQQTFQKILHLRIDYFNDKNNTEIINSMQMDVENVTSVIDRYTIMSISFLFRIISGLAGLFIISWKLSIMVVLMVPIKYFIVSTISRHKKQKMGEFIESYRDFSSWFGDTVEGVKEINLWNLFRKQQSTFKIKQEKLLNNNKENTMLDAFNLFCEIILSWSITGLLYMIGGFLVINGRLTIGGILSFITYSNYVTGPISSLLNLKYLLSRIYPSAERLFSFLDRDDDIDLGRNIDINEETLRIQLKDISFSYSEKGVVLKNINLDIKKGDKIAIIGANGSGKTTLINVLLRFLEPTSGVIEICGTTASKICLEQYRSLFAVVSQEPHLFYDTIYHNVNLDLKASEDIVKKAYLQSGAYDFIHKLSEKENSIIGQNGAKLSGGEKKKIAVARAIVKDAPFVLLDEATAGYDAESDSYLGGILLHEFNDKAVIMITHNDKHLEGMDRVYRLSDGSLEEVIN